jgi:ABC-type lipoprotein release transport system permease subunit
MTTIRLALRNLFGAGLRTWLNVFVLSFSFVAIIWIQGFLQGVNRQVEDTVTAVEYGEGQYWQEHYDPFDPLSLQDAHAALPTPLANFVTRGQATPILVIQGTIYPGGRIQPVLLKGIDPAQTVLTLPSKYLASAGTDIPALIGSRMAKSANLRKGDNITVEWRDIHGTFDAREVHIVQVMSTTVQSVDQGTIWLPLSALQVLTGMPGEASLVVVGRNVKNPESVSGWKFRNPDFLLKDIHDLIKAKSAGSSVLFVVLLFLAMLAIFDTQVLSIFRRKREMGTLMALGMTRRTIIGLFTIEGAFHGVLAAAAAAIYGIPLLLLFAAKGLGLPTSAMDSFGYAISERIFPVYTGSLVVGTTVLVLVVTTIVSFLPTRQIAKLKPTDALRGRVS